MIDNETMTPKLIDFGSSCFFFGKNILDMPEKRRKYHFYLVVSTPTYFYSYNDCHEATKKIMKKHEYEQH